MTSYTDRDTDFKMIMQSLFEKFNYSYNMNTTTYSIFIEDTKLDIVIMNKRWNFNRRELFDELVIPVYLFCYEMNDDYLNPFDEFCHRYEQAYDKDDYSINELKKMWENENGITKLVKDAFINIFNLNHRDLLDLNTYIYNSNPNYGNYFQ